MMSVSPTALSIVAGICLFAGLCHLFIALHRRRVEERTAELVIANEQGQRKMEERKWAEWALGERVKELNCLYAVSRDMQEDLSLDELCRRVIEHLVPAMQFPEITVPVIELDDRRFASERYTEGLSHGLHVEIRVGGEVRGQLWVYYAEDRPFLIPEEQNLLSGIAEVLERWLDRKRVEEALREAEQEKAIILSSVSELVTYRDRGLGIIWANRAAGESVGLSADELVGRHCYEIWQQRSEPCTGCPVMEALETGEPHEAEMTTPDGRVWSVRGYPVREENGDVIGAVEVTLEITERKRAEETLQESKAWLELAIAGSNGGVWHIELNPDDPSHTLSDEIHLSPRLKGFIGYEDDEFPDSMAAWEGRIIPEDLVILRESSRKHREGQTNLHEVEYRIRHKNGSIRWIYTRGRVQRDEHGRPIRFAGIDWDITERKRAEEALAETNQLLETILQHTHVLVAYLDPQFNFIRVNRAYAEADERDPSFFPGKNHFDLYPNAENKAIFQRVVETGEPYFTFAKPFEYAEHLERGVTFWDWSLVPIKDSAGAVTGLILTLANVTERVQVQQALQRRVEELAILNRVAQTVSTVTDLPSALKAVTETVTYLFDASATVITAMEDDQLKLRAHFERAPVLPGIVGRVCPLADTPTLRRAFDQGQSLVVPDIQTMPLPAVVQERMRALNIHAVMVVPLQARGAVIGMMVIGTDRVDRVFTPNEVNLAETIASDIAGAIENARLYEQAQAVAVDAERQRLARELHDSVTQSLYSITLFANGWGTMAEQGRLGNLADCFKHISDVGQQALKEMRLLIHQLRPSILEEVGLVGALQQRLDAVERLVNVETHLLTQGKVDDLPHAVEEQLFHIAQEALNNALQHANATAVSVRIRSQAGRVILFIQDNGTGFDPTSDLTGMGLVTMQERAEAIGGKVAITSMPQQGTTVEVTVAIEPGESV